MPKAISTSTTPRRRPEDAATITLMLLKAAVLGPDFGGSPVKASPKPPVLAGGEAVRVMEAV